MLLFLIPLIIFILLCIATTIWWGKIYKNNWEEVFAICIVVLFVGGLISGLSLAFDPVCDKAFIEEMKATQATLDMTRGDSSISKLEFFKLQETIIEMNRKLASKKVWCEHPLTNWYHATKLLREVKLIH